MTWKWTWDGVANSSVNMIPASAEWTMYYFKEALKQAGWTVVKSSDGSTYNSSGDQITSGNSGAGGMNNNNVWWIVQSPAGAGGFQMCWQSGSNRTQWRLKWSHSAGFTGGSPSASQVPSASDEKVICGGGSDASPTFYGWLAGNGTYRAHIGCSTVYPYSCYLIMANFADTYSRHFWLLELASGSYPSADVTPYVLEVSANYASIQNLTRLDLGPNYSIGQGYYKKGLSGEAWVSYRAEGLDYGNNNFWPLGTVNPYNGRQELSSIHVYRNSVFGDSYAGTKGDIPLSVMGWKTAYRQRGDWMDSGGVRYAYFDEIAVVWPTAVVPAV